MPRPPYFDAFDIIHFEREDGILEYRLHTNGGPLMWDYASVNRQLIDSFSAVARDRDNAVVIMTGTGNSFTGPEVPAKETPGAPSYSGRPWSAVFEDIHSLVNNLLSIPVPMIAAVNGPALRHCELPMLCDIVLVTEDTVFQDSAHFRGGIVPGDGKHVVYPLLMGVNRARYFMLTAQRLGASESLQMGLVNEIVPRTALLDRARTLARQISKQSDALRRYTRLLLTERIRRELNETLALGAALEGLGIWADSAAPSP
jgi:enoyl-CoA hydratase/carnithine racemase